jgi:hypothetical protein
VQGCIKTDAASAFDPIINTITSTLKGSEHYSCSVWGPVRRNSYRILGPSIAVSFVIELFFLSDAFAQPCQAWIAKAVLVEGSIQARKESETEWHPVKMWDEFCPGDIVRLLENSRAAIVLVNGVVLRFDQNTTITFKRTEKEMSLIEILKGVVNFFSRWPKSLKVYAPFVNGKEM